jgi:asparagine synthase (glutamine-hydrolysing)
MRGLLPDVILNRGKQGYSLPIKNWLRAELHDFMLDTFQSSSIVHELFDVRYLQVLVDEHLAFRANHNHVLWAVLNLAVWHRTFGDESRATRLSA